MAYSQQQFLENIFSTQEALEILKNRFIIFIGDSVIRAMYKDLVKFLQSGDYLTEAQLKFKGEYKFENDMLLEGGQKGVMSNDTTYTEVREFKTPHNLIRFYFVTRCYSDYLISICDDIKSETEKPDLVIMNSGCWDLTRYGPNGLHEYKRNLPVGIFSLIKVLPSYSTFLWTSTMPVSKDVRGGFMIPEVECTKRKLREDVLEANQYAYYVMCEYDLDFLDLHYYFHKQIHRRAKDGIHWDCVVHRRITNLILNHLCKIWKYDTPGRLMIKNNPSIIEPPSSQQPTETQQEQENLFMSDESRDGTDSVFDHPYNQYNNGGSQSNGGVKRRVVVSSQQSGYSEYSNEYPSSKRARLNSNMPSTSSGPQRSHEAFESRQVMIREQSNPMLIQQQLQQQLVNQVVFQQQQQHQQQHLAAQLHLNNPLSALALYGGNQFSHTNLLFQAGFAGLTQQPQPSSLLPMNQQQSSYDHRNNLNKKKFHKN